MTLTWSISVPLAESDIAELHSAVADNHKARQAGELRVLHRNIARQSLKAQHKAIVCNSNDQSNLAPC